MMCLSVHASLCVIVGRAAWRPLQISVERMSSVGSLLAVRDWLARTPRYRLRKYSLGSSRRVRSSALKNTRFHRCVRLVGRHFLHVVQTSLEAIFNFFAAQQDEEQVVCGRVVLRFAFEC